MRFNYITLTFAAAVMMSAFVTAAPASPNDEIHDALTVSKFDEAQNSQGKGRPGATDALVDSKTIADGIHRRDEPVDGTDPGPEIDIEVSRSNTDAWPEKKEGENPEPGSSNGGGKFNGA